VNELRPISVSALVIRQGALRVVLPGALVAQVMSRFGELVPVPGTEEWLLGVTAWRSLAVPVISPEALLAGRAPARPERSRLVVCYPLPGRGPTEFFAFVAPEGVHTHTVDGAAGAVEIPPGARRDLIAGALALGDGGVGVIPDLNRLREEFYRR
jgi:chemotaxis signal transduction protein